MNRDKPLKEAEYPLFLCEVVGDQWRFWCPYCRVRHMHDSDGYARRPVHREALCHTDSPLKATGYLLKPEPKRRDRKPS
jgi:hypothetical protein